MLDLSIVIVSWNTRQILKDCLESVYQETQKASFEVIVVDNHSNDGSVEMVQSDFPQAKLIANTENRGFAAANNQGFELCQGRWVLLLNSDTLVLDGALDKTVAWADSKTGMGVGSCRVLNADKTIQPNVFMYPSVLNNIIHLSGLYKPFSKNMFFGRAEMTWWDYQDERQVEVLKGCFMLVRKEALDQVGPMDEQFFMYSEEIDWCYRFTEENWSIYYYPGAEIIHLGGASAAKLGGDRALIKDRSTKRYMRKHWSSPAYWAGIATMILFYLTRLPLVTVLYLFTFKPSYKKRMDNHWTGLKGLLTNRSGNTQ